MNINNKWTTFGIAIIMSFAQCTIMHGMNESANTAIQESSTTFKDLPQDLRNVVLPHEAIQFLRSSPITLKKHHCGKVTAIATNEDKVAASFVGSNIQIWNKKTGNYLHTIIPGHKQKRTYTKSFIQGLADYSTDEFLSQVAIHNDMIISVIKEESNSIIGDVKNTVIEIWNINTGELLYEREFKHPIDVQIVETNNVKIIIKSDNNIILKDINTNEPLRELSEPDSTNTNDKYSITYPYYGPLSIKIWPHEFIKQGTTAQDNALEWIIQKADDAQLNFIQRAFAATHIDKDLTINWPQQLGTIHESDSQEQVDGNIYFSFPEFVREYLYNRLNISRVPYHTSEKILNAPCLIQ